jgi:hypothetical protein
MSIVTAKPRQQGVKTFRIPRLLIDTGALKTLSGDALALFIGISYRCYRTREADIKYSFKEIYADTNLLGRDVKPAAKELRAAGLIFFQQDEQTMSFQIAQPHGSKARGYLREPPASPPPITMMD